MTPNEYALETMKVYEAYKQSKEHLVEVTTTLYLAFVGALLLKNTEFWRVNFGRALFIWLGTAAIGLIFVGWQMGLRRQATSMSEASQSLLAEWLAHPPSLLDPSLEPRTQDGEFSGVKLPAALWAELDVRRKRTLNCCDAVRARLFAIVIYGLSSVWTLALLYRIYLAWQLRC